MRLSWKLCAAAPVPIEFEPMAENMDGYFSSEQQRIAIREGMSEVQTVSAAVHETAHSKLHDPKKYEAEPTWKIVMVSEGGTIIILSACTEGFGSPDTQHQICDFDNMDAREKTCARIFPSAVMWVFCSRNRRKSTISSWFAPWLRRTLPKQGSTLSQPWMTPLPWQKSSTAARICARHCCPTGPIHCPSFRRPIARAVHAGMLCGGGAGSRDTLWGRAFL